MTLSAQPLDEYQMRKFLSAELQCPGPLSALRTAIIAEHIRTLVSAPYFRSREVISQPVHTSRIFAELDRNTRFLYSGEYDLSKRAIAQHSEYEFVRDQLERYGDLFHVGKGFWIPGPVRLIRATKSPTAIVLGGAPTSILQREFCMRFHSIGPARYISNLNKYVGIYPEESTADWLGSTEPLSEWTENILSWATTQLKEQAEIDDDSIEIYAPDVHRARRRLGFWMEVKEFREPAPTLRLFRPKKAGKWVYDRPDFLGVFNSRSGGSQLVRSVRIPRDMANRLQFGFDQRFSTARTFILRSMGDIYRLDLNFALPDPERKVLGFAWRESALDSVLFFDNFALPVLYDVGAMLGIRVQQN